MSYSVGDKYNMPESRWSRPKIPTKYLTELRETSGSSDSNGLAEKSGNTVGHHHLEASSPETVVEKINQG